MNKEELIKIKNVEILIQSYAERHTDRGGTQTHWPRLTIGGHWSKEEDQVHLNILEI